MTKGKWLSILLMLCLLVLTAHPALSEDAEPAPAAVEAEAEAETADASDGEAATEAGADDDGDDVIVSAQVDGDVTEITVELGADEPDPPQEDPVEDVPMPEQEAAFDGGGSTGCYIPYPDVCDLRYAMVPSSRVYPGELVWPLRGATPLMHVTSHVGWRNAGCIHGAQGGTWASWVHHGVDVGHVTTRQVVVAAAPGVAYADHRAGSGNYVVIDHGNGWYTKYQHLSRFAGAIEKGSRGVEVDYGDPIGYVGSSGGDYPVHFHFEIAWSPDGPGSDDRDYSHETSNWVIKAFSFPQESVVYLRWAARWEICSAENQRFVRDRRDITQWPAEAAAVADGGSDEAVADAPEAPVSEEVGVELSDDAEDTPDEPAMDVAAVPADGAEEAPDEPVMDVAAVPADDAEDTPDEPAGPKTAPSGARGAASQRRAVKNPKHGPAAPAPSERADTARRGTIRARW